MSVELVPTLEVEARLALQAGCRHSPLVTVPTLLHRLAEARYPGHRVYYRPGIIGDYLAGSLAAPICIPWPAGLLVVEILHLSQGYPDAIQTALAYVTRLAIETQCDSWRARDELPPKARKAFPSPHPHGREHQLTEQSWPLFYLAVRTGWIALEAEQGIQLLQGLYTVANAAALAEELLAPASVHIETGELGSVAYIHAGDPRGKADRKRLIDALDRTELRTLDIALRHVMWPGDSREKERAAQREFTLRRAAWLGVGDHELARQWEEQGLVKHQRKNRNEPADCFHEENMRQIRRLRDQLKGP